MIHRPQFITFTGADDRNDPAAMALLAARYPIEWGILLSPKRQGSPRYPSLEWIRRFLAVKPGRISAHLCGAYSAALVDLHPLPGEIDEIVTNHFHRAQINGAPAHAARQLTAWGAERMLQVILQAPQGFPSDASVTWLHDGSGGRGISPDTWPAPPIPSARVGYAGGLRAENIAPAVDTISAVARNYWLDMESGVRDKGDRFSLTMCHDICELVYGY